MEFLIGLTAISKSITIAILIAHADKRFQPLYKGVYHWLQRWLACHTSLLSSTTCILACSWESWGNEQGSTIMSFQNCFLSPLRHRLVNGQITLHYCQYCGLILHCTERRQKSRLAWTRWWESPWVLSKILPLHFPNLCASSLSRSL